MTPTNGNPSLEERRTADPPASTVSLGNVPITEPSRERALDMLGGSV
jgi:hypothetical protein